MSTHSALRAYSYKLKTDQYSDEHVKGFSVGNITCQSLASFKHNTKAATNILVRLLPCEVLLANFDFLRAGRI